MKSDTQIKIPIYLLLIIMVGIMFQLYQLNKSNNEVRRSVAYLGKELTSALKGSKPPKPLEEGINAPDFSLMSTSGELISLSSLGEDKKKILVFSSNTCHFCKEFYPKLASFNETNPDISLVLVQSGATQEENKVFLETHKYFDKVLVEESSVAKDYLVSGTPTSVLLSENNTVLKVSSGVSALDKINEVLN